MKFILEHISYLVHFAGVAQIALAIFSISIPFVLKWKEEMSKVNGLIRNVFYTYSVYIFATNVWFGVMSVCLPNELVSASPLAIGLTIFIALYWWGRVFVQIFFGKAEGKPKGIIFTIGEIALWVLFIILSLIYSLAALYNLNILN